MYQDDIAAAQSEGIRKAFMEKKAALARVGMRQLKAPQVTKKVNQQFYRKKKPVKKPVKKPTKETTGPKPAGMLERNLMGGLGLLGFSGAAGTGAYQVGKGKGKIEGARQVIDQGSQTIQNMSLEQKLALISQLMLGGGDVKQTFLNMIPEDKRGLIAG